MRRCFLHFLTRNESKSSLRSKWHWHTHACMHMPECTHACTHNVLVAFWVTRPDTWQSNKEGRALTHSLGYPSWLVKACWSGLGCSRGTLGLLTSWWMWKPRAHAGSKRKIKPSRPACGDPFPLASFCVRSVPQHPKAALASWGTKCSNSGTSVGYFRCKPLHMLTYHRAENSD